MSDMEERARDVARSLAGTIEDDPDMARGLIAAALVDFARDLVTRNAEVLAKIQRCSDHGASPNAWGCPECVREARHRIPALEAELAAARALVQVREVESGAIRQTEGAMIAELAAAREEIERANGNACDFLDQTRELKQAMRSALDESVRDVDVRGHRWHEEFRALLYRTATPGAPADGRHGCGRRLKFGGYYLCGGLGAPLCDSCRAASLPDKDPR